MNRATIIAAALALACISCGKDKERETKLRRSGDNAAVVVVGAEEANAGLGLAKEQEPNNESGQAQGISLGAGVTGSMDGSTDVDRYQIDVSEEGQLFVRIEGAEDADLILELQKVDGSTLAVSDRGPKATVEGVAGYWVEAGMSYQLVVREFTKRKLRKTGGRTGASSPYRLTAKVETAQKQDFELEPNEDLEGAKELGLGVSAHGYLGWSGDVDWWRIPVTGFTELSVEGDGHATRVLDIAVTGTTRVATVMELSSSAGEPIVTLTAAQGKEVALRSLVPAVTADFYILKLHAKRSNPEESYQVRVDSRERSPGEEEEPNNTIELANTIASEVGVLAKASGELSLGDVDMFSLEPAEMNRSMDLRLEGPSTADLSVSVVSESGELLAVSETPGVGQGETLQAVNVAPNSSPVIIVRATKVDLPAGYKLSVSVTEGQGIPQAPAPPAAETPESVE